VDGGVAVGTYPVSAARKAAEPPSLKGRVGVVIQAMVPLGPELRPTSGRHAINRSVRRALTAGRAYDIISFTALDAALLFENLPQADSRAKGYPAMMKRSHDQPRLLRPQANRAILQRHCAAQVALVPQAGGYGASPAGEETVATVPAVPRRRQWRRRRNTY